MDSEMNVPASATEACYLRVRLPVMKDFPALLEIANWATCHTAANMKVEPDTLEHWVDLWQGKAQRYPWFVAEQGGAVVGFAMASPFQSRCGYAYSAEVTVYVEPRHVGRGVGRALYARLIPTLRTQGFHTLIAAITVPNPASEQLHANVGFRKVGVLEQAGWKLGEWQDIAFWQLVLQKGDGPPEPIKPVSSVLGENGGDCTDVITRDD